MWLMATMSDSTGPEYRAALQRRGQHILSIKNQAVNPAGFVDRMVSVTTAQLCCCGTKVATATTYTIRRGSVPIKLYL